jgi:hypothetical protein
MSYMSATAGCDREQSEALIHNSIFNKKTQMQNPTEVGSYTDIRLSQPLLALTKVI